MSPAEREAIQAVEEARRAVEIAMLELHEAREQLSLVTQREGRQAIAGQTSAPLRLVTPPALVEAADDPAG
jgi:hypothetical protein